METRHHVALIEIGGSHDECILSQLYALKSVPCRITLVTTHEVIERNSLFYSLVDAVHLIEFPKKAIGDFLLMYRLNKYFHLNGIQKVIINTAQGGHIRNLCFTSFRSIEFIGIIHTLNKFKGSFTQKQINRKIKKYFVLNDYFLDKIIPPTGITVKSFYPLRFPSFEDTVKKNEDEIWITIIGGLENRRKDLIGSIPLMKELEHKNVRFIFLGKSDPNKAEVDVFLETIEAVGLNEKVKTFHAFVPEIEFDAYLKQTDLIWPMVNPDTPSSVEYFKNQISGAMNVSFGYKIPMLVHEKYFSEWSDLQYAFAYNLTNFKSSFEFAIENLNSKVQALKQAEKFDPEYQEGRYVEFIFPSRNNFEQ